jgi:hypothetical protein
MNNSPQISPNVRLPTVGILMNNINRFQEATGNNMPSFVNNIERVAKSIAEAPNRNLALSILLVDLITTTALCCAYPSNILQDICFGSLGGGFGGAFVILALKKASKNFMSYKQDLESQQQASLENNTNENRPLPHLEMAQAGNLGNDNFIIGSLVFP